MTAVAIDERSAHETASLDRPSVNGPLPGPRSKELLERQEARETNARTYPRRLPIAIDRGEGSYVVDLDGNVFIDFLTGAGTMPLGHSHPELIAAVQAQLPRFQHGLDFPTEIRDEFASMHLARLPAELRSRVRWRYRCRLVSLP